MFIVVAWLLYLMRMGEGIGRKVQHYTGRGRKFAIKGSRVTRGEKSERE